MEKNNDRRQSAAGKKRPAGKYLMPGKGGKQTGKAVTKQARRKMSAQPAKRGTKRPAASENDTRQEILRTDRKNYERGGSVDIAPTASSRPAGGRKSAPLRIIPLGGLNEIGKNLYLYECCNDMFIVDCGLVAVAFISFLKK